VTFVVIIALPSLSGAVYGVSDRIGRGVGVVIGDQYELECDWSQQANVIPLPGVTHFQFYSVKMTDSYFPGERLTE
jgi:hypothetical protein